MWYVFCACIGSIIMGVAAESEDAIRTVRKVGK
ncbi:hypothetical protein HNQ94_000380 [Salirhabdus euzebyi]|uniref:Uncharacterized protein n=1 Tax=Salirhabdus euzebyi TaxID=394506 RepID=A0A841PT10_9BACI|nr:hypothetical protein [Salirhabdus euzebyi]